jgi:NAD(P)-dependent dehydrogenase (short-subunit alcohol dehydrogenase family)
VTPPETVLRGQVALVTGAGRGIGRVFARALADRSPDQVAETVALITAAGGRALAVPVDVTERAAVDAAVAAVERALGPVDLLVNNAGVWGPVAPVWEADADAWWRAMEVNLRGSFLCSRAVLAGMVARRRGRIVNIASHAGVHRWPTVSAYAVSKAAIVKLTENLAAETSRLGVRVFAVHPGVVTIGLTDDAQALARRADPASHEGRAAAWVLGEVAAGRAVPPERGAALVVALAAGRADALSGRYVTVDDDLTAMLARVASADGAGLYTLRLHTGT